VNQFLRDTGHKMKRTLLASALALTTAFGANAELLSLDSDFGTDTITYDTQTGLGWLDVEFTDKISYNTMLDRLENDDAYEHYRLVTYAEYEDMINKLFPSLFTATSFYQGNKASPIVDTTESALFRELFGNGKQVDMGKASDGETLRWAGSNSWNSGQVAYTEYYTSPGGASLDSNKTYGNSTSVNGWFLVSTGEVNLSDGTFNAKDVPVPLLGFAGLGLLAMGIRRRQD
tara:strand:- start:5025 stop:5717 length:693 start_codon:yes stop_codon:yes gene_type:complete